MTISGQRTVCKCLVALGVILCLSPSAAGMYVMWARFFAPMIAMGPERFNRVMNQQELQQRIQTDPVVLVALFVVAPLGVALIVLSLRRLRRLRRPPSLPPNYGMADGIR